MKNTRSIKIVEENAVLCNLLKALQNNYFEGAALTWMCKVWIAYFKITH